jgi:3-oxoacyl-[acyl-carrier protein] reductase
VTAMFSLDGKYALVTGAGSSSGIGFAAARALLELGAQVYITSTSSRIHDRARELGIQGFIADLTIENQVDSLFHAIPSLDILVNNAGMTNVSSPADEKEASDVASMSIIDWQRGMARNLDTAFLVTKYALPLLRKSSSGRIIMVSSVTGHVMAMKNQPVYAAAKSAMVGLTKSVALDESRFGITCNAVLPGWIATESISNKEKANGSRVPMGRGGRADEVAALVAWLATSEASYITGQAIVIDGGNSIQEERS